MGSASPYPPLKRLKSSQIVSRGESVEQKSQRRQPAKGELCPEKKIRGEWSRQPGQRNGREFFKCRQTPTKADIGMKGRGDVPPERVKVAQGTFIVCELRPSVRREIVAKVLKSTQFVSRPRSLFRRLLHDRLDDRAVDVGQAAVEAVVAVGQLFVVDAEQP